MIVTKQQLQQLIDEEFSRALEKRKQRLSEARGRFHGSQELREMEAYELLEFAKAYAGLGNAVQDQLHDIMDDPQSDVNPNAIDLIKERLGGANEEIDSAIQAYEEYQTGEPGGERDDEDEDDGSLAYAAKVNKI